MSSGDFWLTVLFGFIAGHNVLYRLPPGVDFAAYAAYSVAGRAAVSGCRVEQQTCGQLWRGVQGRRPLGRKPAGFRLHNKTRHVAAFRLPSNNRPACPFGCGYAALREDVPGVAKKLNAAMQAGDSGRLVAAPRQSLGQFLDRWLRDVVKPTARACARTRPTRRKFVFTSTLSWVARPSRLHAAALTAPVREETRGGTVRGHREPDSHRLVWRS